MQPSGFGRSMYSSRHGAQRRSSAIARDTTCVLSVVIPARNAERALGATLADLAQADVGEVIVVDNGSSDRTGDVARDADARVVTMPRPGRAAARNAGAAAATA